MSDDRYMRDPKAKTCAGILEGLQLIWGDNLEKKWPMHAEHDVLYVGGEEIPEDSEKGIRLTALGFHWSSEGDCWAFFT